MPPGYAIVHLLLVAGGAAGAALVARGSPGRARGLALALVLGVVPLQLALVKWPRTLAASGWSDVVFFVDAWPAIAVALGVVGALAAPTRAARIRAGVLCAALVGVACAATTVPWRTPPLRLGAPQVEDGVVRQTDEGSCCPAAAATLLRELGLVPDATEAALAQECLTDSVWGTSDLGLFRGLSRAAPGRRVRFVEPGLDALRARRAPAIVFVGLRASRVPDPRLFELLRTRCGWTEGLSHAVVLSGFAPGGPGEAREVALVSDPGAGRERWSLEHFVALWEGAALVVE